MIVSPRPNTRLVAVEVRVRDAGSAHESPAENGLAHAVEHLVFKGGDAPGVFDARFERMGGEVVAQTSRDATAYRVTVLPEHAVAAINLLGEMLMRPRFRDADWNAERTVIGREMRVAQSDARKQGLQCVATGTHTTGDALAQPIMGSPANLARFTAADLQAFHAAHYTPANLVVAVCGAVDADTVTKAVETAFAPPTAPPQVTPASIVPLPEVAPASTIQPVQIQRELATLYIGFGGMSRLSDPANAVAADVLAAFLVRGGDGGAGVLGAKVSGNVALETVSLGADYLPGVSASAFVMFATSDKRTVGKVEDALVAELSALALRLADGDTATLADELSAAKAAAIGEAKYRRETVDGEAQYLAYLATLNAPDDYADKYAERVRAVTFADLLRILNRAVTPAKRVSVVVGLDTIAEPIVRRAETTP